MSDINAQGYLESLLELEDGTRPIIKESARMSPAERELVSSYWSTLSTYRTLLFENIKPRGSVEMGLRGDNSSSNELFIFDGAFDISVGSFPWELSLKTKLSASVGTRNVQEDLSNLHVSYDFHIPSHSKPLNTEFFIFANRFEDDYIGVDQRYEVGGGLILQGFSSALNAEGEKESKNLDTAASFRVSQHGIRYCNRDLCSIFDSRGMDVSLVDMSAFKNAKSTVDNYQTKKYAKFRWGLLIGAFYEIEQISAVDSFSNTTEISEINFEGTNQFKFELRPFIELNYQFLKFSAKPYMKFPVLNFLTEVGEETKADIRFDIPVTLEVPLSKKSSVKLAYTWYYDNAPRFRTVSDNSGATFFVVAGNSHHNVTLKFKYGFM